MRKCPGRRDARRAIRYLSEPKRRVQETRTLCPLLKSKPGEFKPSQWLAPNKADNRVDVGLISAVIAGAVSETVTVVGYVLTKLKERETDWRKIKLDLYRAYVLALSGVVRWDRTAEDQAKYADALNILMLVASADVLRAGYAFMDAPSDPIDNDDATSKAKRLDELLKALRQDIYPGANRGGGIIQFRLMSPPSQTTVATSHSQSG